MHTLRQRFARFGFSCGLAATLTLGAVIPALADDGDGTIQLTPGTQSAIIGDFAFAARNLTGAAQTSTAAPAIAVTDATGDGAGWHIQMSATAFTGTGTDQSETSRTLVAAPRVTAAPITSPSLTNDVDYDTPVSISTTPAKIASAAAAQSSNGQFTVTPDITIDIPADTYAVTAAGYKSIFTVSIVAGP